MSIDRGGAALVMCVALVACGRSPTSPDTSGPIQAVATATGIRLTNTTNEPFAFTTIDRRSLAMFAPCADPSPQCLRLGPRATLVTAYQDAIGFGSDTTEILVYFWHVETTAGGGSRPADVQSLTVPVPR